MVPGGSTFTQMNELLISHSITHFKLLLAAAVEAQAATQQKHWPETPGWKKVTRIYHSIRPSAARLADRLISWHRLCQYDDNNNEDNKNSRNLTNCIVLRVCVCLCGYVECAAPCG